MLCYCSHLDFNPNVDDWNTITSNQILGSGGYSSVYLYQDPVTTKKYAAKLFHSNCKEFFLRELSILQLLDFHRNIVKLEGTVQIADVNVLLLSYLDGKDLHQKIADKEYLQYSQISQVMQELFTALDFLIYKKVIHRDIKPANVIYLNTAVDSVRIKVIDFGLSNVYDRKNARVSISGTAGMVAPEVLEHNVAPGYDIDMWGAGIVLYYLLVHEYPFEKENHRDSVDERIVRCDYDQSGELFISSPALLQQLVAQLLVNRLPRLSPAYCRRVLRDSVFD